MKKLSILLSILVLFFSSCKKNLPDVGGTSAEKMANEWWVTFELNGVDLYGTHEKIATSNTSNNNNEIWVSDFWKLNPLRGNIWAFQVKAQADLNNMTFSANQAVSIVPTYDIKVNIKEGKIIKNGGRSKSGNVTDSIYMKIEFEDDATPFANTYELKGHARTKFEEDDY